MGTHSTEESLLCTNAIIAQKSVYNYRHENITKFEQAWRSKNSINCNADLLSLSSMCVNSMFLSIDLESAAMVL